MNMLRPEALKHLHPGWFSIVMGLAGLSLAWAQAARSMGGIAGALALGALAALAFVALLGLSWWRWLLAGVAVSALGQAGGWAAALWWLGSLGQMGATVWALGRWINNAQAGGWAQLTPSLFLPAVGNVVAALAGGAVGAGPWAAAQFGVGVTLWLALLTLLLARLAVHGVWTQRLLPLTFITIAPPAVAGMALLQLGGPAVLAWMAWGVALMFLLWSLNVMPRMLAQPASVTWWALSFPLAAFAALSLRLAGHDSGVMGALALLALAFASLTVAALVLATLQGLRDGAWLAPEQVALSVAAPPDR